MSDHHSKAIEPAAVELANREERQLHPIIAAAMRGQIQPEVLRDLLAVQREYEAGEAKKAFTQALVNLKRELPSVINRDKIVDYKTSKGRTRYSHASLGATMDAIEEPLNNHGFSVSWYTDNDERKIKVSCRLTHEYGHHEETSISSPPDTSGGKGPAQAIASTITYLRRYTLLALLGIATADMSEPHGPVEQDPDSVDINRNLKASSWIRKNKKKVEDAEEMVGRPVKEWTGADLESIKAWVSENKNQNSE